MGLSAGTGKHCVFGHLGLVFIWSCFVFCHLFLLFYVISAPVPAEAAYIQDPSKHFWAESDHMLFEPEYGKVSALPTRLLE